MNNKFLITGGIVVITLFIITIFGIACSNYDYIKNTKITNKYDIIINEKDSCIYKFKNGSSI